MKKFEFKMQKILDLRQYEQKQAEAELGKANAEVARIQAKLDDIAHKKAHTVTTYNTETDFTIVNQIQQFFKVLDIKKEEYLQELVSAQMVADQKRAVVLECMKKTKALEKLREKHLAKWKIEEARKEEVVVDDMVNGRFYSASSGS
ncbi:MAG: flagellar export protein FliJ [Treponema sp.]|nr:flagellar export protein FliJ [Candidatus Treponema equi]